MSAILPLKKLSLFFLLMMKGFLAIAQLGPQFTATPLSGCAPLVVQFTDQSTGGATIWNWDLGNNITSVLQNPSTTYFNPGTYTIKLVIRNAAGDRDSITKSQYITVNARPSVSFTGSPLSGCFPLPVQFNNTSIAGSGTISSYFWDFGDGNSSTLVNPLHIYTGAGTNAVSLQVTNSAGCSKSFTIPSYVNVSAGITALFSNNSASGCGAPQTISFVNQSSGTSLLTYAWDFGDGGTSSQTNPTYTYTTTGSFSVQLTVTNAAGCTKIYTNPSPIIIGTVSASFNTQSPICAGSPVTFTNTSTPTPVSASWNFGDGTTSTAISPTKTFASASAFTVTLVSNFGGCQASTSQTISVSPKPTAIFSANPTSSCSAPLNVTFANSSTGATSSEWLFGDGATSSSINPTHTYSSQGTYGVTLIVTNANGCTDTLRSPNSISIRPPVATINALPKQDCAPLAHAFSASVNTVVPVVGYQWDFGDGTTSTLPNPNHIFPLGSYNIQLVITTAGGCTDTVRVLNGIIAAPKPITNFTANPTNVCAFNPVTFQDLTTGITIGTTWLWSFGDGNTSTIQNPSHSYEDTGYFDVQLIVSNNGCSDTIKFLNYIHVAPPIAAFTWANDCANKYTRAFVDQSIGADTYAWNFGDGVTSTLPAPTHIYSSVGTYTVTLTVHNNISGCDHTKTSSLVVSDEAANFTASLTQLCKNSATTFNATSLNTPSGITSYTWNFGDNTTGTGNGIAHTYANAGTYSVKLIVADINGCLDSLTRPAYIMVFGPTADFNPSVPGSCLQQNIAFNDLSTTDGIHSIVEWTWNYGDGTPVQILTSPPFTHAYNSSGQYAVSLSVKDSYGCSTSIVKTNVLTISTPFADFISDPVETCPGQPVIFTNLSTGPSLTYAWTFGDGATSTQANPVHIYNSNGTFDIRLIVTDLYGCTDDTLKQQYIIIKSPSADFTVSDSLGTCSSLNVQFTNTSLNAQSSLWDFGDGNTSSALNPTHFYSAPGVYTAKLTITSIGNCTSVKTKIIRVRGPQGTFSYSPISGCNPLTVNFIANTIDRVSFIWDFSDGSTLSTTDSLVSHTYNTPGNYVPKMILIGNVSGCAVPIIGLDTIKINGALANFIQDTLLKCNSGDIIFTNTSITSEAIINYAWNFGDGNTSSIPNPTHFYSGPGLYYPSLTITTASGCTNPHTSIVPIKVVKTPQPSIAQPLNGCVPWNFSLSGNLISPDTSAITWKWILSNGNIVTSQNLSNQIFNTVGINNVKLIATNSSGCIDSTDKSFEVYPKPTVNAGADIVICKGVGQPISVTGAANYIWSPALGLSCSACASPIATPDSVRNYTVTGTSLQGCANTDNIKVSVMYPFDIVQGPGATLCTGQSGKLTTSGAYRYEWSPSIGLNLTTGNIVTANPTTTTTYMAVGFDDKNCFTDTATYLVKVYPIPTINAGSDKTINVGQTTTLTPIFSNDVTNITWTPSTWVVANTYPSITIKPNLNQEYKVTVKNDGGCTSSDIVNVFVLCDGTNFFIPNTFSPNGDGMNDWFYPRGTGLFTIKQFRIFDRWGEEVFARYTFRANDEKSGWDGTFKGQKVTSDAYVYLIEIQCDNNATLIYKGNIALIK